MENIQKLLCEMQVDLICASKNTKTNAPSGSIIPSPFYEARFGVEIFVELYDYAFVTSLLLRVVKIHYLYRNWVLLLWLPAYFATHFISICGILHSY